MPDKVWYRGVEKNKLVFKRCRPVMARYEGCGVCMPHGRAEDWILVEFRNKLMENKAKNGDGANEDLMWEDFRGKMEESLEDREVPVDMGMDRGI